LISDHGASQIQQSESSMKPAPHYVPPHDLLKGKSVLVTAAAGAGIGFAVAKRAAEEGCRALFISDVHERRLQEAVEAIQRDTGLQAVFGLLCDVSQEAQVQALVDAAHERMGGIDVLVNNAGLGTSKRIVDMADDEWHKVLDVTLTGTFRMMRAALKVMQPRGQGVIVNNASVLGWRAQVEQAHYAAAKAGVMALTRCAAMEAAEFGVRINAVAPSIAIHAFLKKSASEELLNELSAKEAFGRGAEPWEVANVMIFLASDYSSYMTGEVVSVSSQHA
jgi:3-oxoacyl-[acyl-carrier protein] reductase